MPRKRKERQLKNPIINIIGEGSTERYYFMHLKKLKGYKYVCKPRNFSEHSFEEIERQIEKVLSDDGLAVCVFDADVTRIHEAEKRKLGNLRKKYAYNPSVLLCDSMPSIEFWFLLHFLKTNRYFATSHDVVMALKKFIPTFSKNQSFLCKEQWVSEMSTDEKLESAISNAILIGDEGQSYTNMHRLFNLLTNTP